MSAGNGSMSGSKQPRRVLVREVNWLGDVVMSLPALRAVRAAWPRAHLAVLIRRELAGFFGGSDWVDEVIPYHVGPGPGGIRERYRIVRHIRAGGFDTALLLPRSFQSALWVALARVPVRAGFSDDARKLLLTHSAAYGPVLFGRHQSLDYLHMLRETLAIEGREDDFVPDVCTRSLGRMRAWLAEQRKRPDRPLVALSAAAAYGPAKEWPAARFSSLIDVLAEKDGSECVLVGTASERARCVSIAAASRGGALVAAGETNVGELIALLSLCTAFAGNDSGAMHVAGALGIRTVGVYGSTRPHRTSPLGPHTHVIYHPIDCSPCMQRTCRYGHYDCLRQISVAEVVATLSEPG